jgi:hypothetical protein
MKLFICKQGKVWECAVAETEADALDVLNQYFDGQAPITKVEAVEIVDVDTKEGVISWKEYAARFDRATYWGYYNPKTDKWERIIS